MSKKQLMLFTGIIALAVSALAITIRVSSNPLKNTIPPQQRITTTPGHVIYSAFFHHVAEIEAQAKEAQRRGNVTDAASLHSFFQRQADLSEEHAQILNQIASDCTREVAEQDAKAQAIIKVFREKYPLGQLPKGTKLPPPPPELKTMQEERNAIILRARDRLRLALGDEAFQNLDDFVVKKVGSNIQRTPLLTR